MSENGDIRAELLRIFEALTRDGREFLLAVARIAARHDGAGNGGAGETRCSSH